MNELVQLFDYLEQQKVTFSIIEDLEITPYTIISLTDFNILIHYIKPTNDTKNWHTDTALLNINQFYKDKKVIHLWSDTWVKATLPVLSRIAGAIGKTTTIYGRSVTIRRIDINTLNHFMELNHISGSPNSKIKYGLFHKEKLVAVASFSGKRKMNDREGLVHQSYELIRYCNLNFHTVVGGLGKILKTFISEQSPDDIMTYTDSDWSQGESFLKLGFDLDNKLKIIPFLWDENTQQRIKIKEQKDCDFVVYNSGSNKYILNLNRINK